MIVTNCYFYTPSSYWFRNHSPLSADLAVKQTAVSAAKMVLESAHRGVDLGGFGDTFKPHCFLSHPAGRKTHETKSSLSGV